MKGYQFGTQYAGKTPLDFMDKEDGTRPGANQGYGWPTRDAKPSGCAVVDLTGGLKQWHVIPPVAIWKRGKWFDTLDKKVQDTIRVDAWDERETWVVSGQGTPGNYILRAYTVPVKVAEYQECAHPSHWSRKQKEEGDGKGLVVSTPAKSTPVSPPKPPPLPANIHFRCPGCGHWFGSETRYAGHSTHCCPGSANWDAEYGSDWVLECECCDTFHETAVCLPGFPRPKKEKQTETGEKEKEAVA